MLVVAAFVGVDVHDERVVFLGRGSGMRRRIHTGNAEGILVAHGFASDTDAETLRAAIEGRGWQVRVVPEDEDRPTGRPWRIKARATRPVLGTRPELGISQHLSADGRTERSVLAEILAKVLERDG